MPNTKLTKDRIKEHFSYSKRMYIVGLIITLLGASLIFDVTRHTPSGPQLIQVGLVDSYCDTEKLNDVTPTLLARAQERDPQVEEFTFLSIAYSGSASSDYNGAQVYTVQVYAGDNDIYVQNEELTVGLIQSGALAPLDKLEGWDEFMQKHPDIAVLWADDTSYTPTGDEDEVIPQHPYALDASQMLGFNTRGAYDIRNKYISISAQCGEYEEMLNVLSDLFELLTPVEEANG